MQQGFWNVGIRKRMKATLRASAAVAAAALAFTAAPLTGYAVRIEPVAQEGVTSNIFGSEGNQSEFYRQISQEWEQLDTALVNIGDYPSSPDFASLVRYGSLLQQQHACGRMLVYYFNEAGTVIQSEQDFAIQVPIDTLRRCPNIIGVCSANTSVKALRGALRSAFFTHIVARSSLVSALLEQ